MSADAAAETTTAPRYDLTGAPADPIVDAIRSGRAAPRSVLQVTALRALTAGTRLLDAGAHVGTTALPAAGAGARVIAVEPDPALAAALRASVDANGDMAGRVRVIEAALAERAGPVSFSPAGPWGHVRKRTELDDVEDRIEVHGAPGDEILGEAGWSGADVIKLSLCGYEARALEGLACTLAGAPAPLLVIESNAHALSWYGDTPASLLEQLRDLGYVAFLVDWRRTERLVPLGDAGLQPECGSVWLCVPESGTLPDRGWVVEPFGEEELIERLHTSCRHESITDRWHAAREIERGPAHLRDDPRLAEALRALHMDPAPMVRDAASFADRARTGNDTAELAAGAPRAASVKLPGGAVAHFHLPPDIDTPIARDLLAAEDYPLYAANRLVLDLVEPGQRFLDLGGHLGTFAVPAALLGAEVLTLEPHPGYADLLAASIEANGVVDRVTLVRAAAGDEAGELELVLDFEWSFLRPKDGHLSGDYAKARRVLVPVVTVDGALTEARWEGADLVKMDLEGFEPRALEGMRGLLSARGAPPVLFESNRGSLEIQGSSVPELLGMFAAFGYSLYLVGCEDEEPFLTPIASDDFQPEPAEEVLAVKGPAPEIAGWTMREPMSHEETVRRILRLARTPFRNYRRLLASALREAPAPLLADPLVEEALSVLREDPEPDVRDAAEWSRKARS